MKIVAMLIHVVSACLFLLAVIAFAVGWREWARFMLSAATYLMLFALSVWFAPELFTTG